MTNQYGSDKFPEKADYNLSFFSEKEQSARRHRREAEISEAFDALLKAHKDTPSEHGEQN